MYDKNNPIESIGNRMDSDAINASSLASTTMPNHNFLDITRVGKNSETQNSQRFNSQEVIANFKDSNAVGINPFQRLTEAQGKNLHLIS